MDLIKKTRDENWEEEDWCKDRWMLQGYVVNSGSHISATANVSLCYNGDGMETVAFGIGPIEAAFHAIENIVQTGVQVRAQVQYPDGDGRGASVTFQWKDKEKGVHAVTSPFSLLPKSYYRGDKLIFYYNTGWQQGHIPANRGLVWTGALGGSASGIINLSWGVWGLTRQKRRQKS